MAELKITYALVKARRNVGFWTKTRDQYLSVITHSRRPRQAYRLVGRSGGCEIRAREPQHAFQVCRRVFAEARDRTYLGNLNPAGPRGRC